MRYINKQQLIQLINNNFSDNISILKMRYWFSIFGFDKNEEKNIEEPIDKIENM